MALPTQKKRSLVIVYTGEGKGKTSAGVGLVCRALGKGSRVAFVQFIKSWKVNEDRFFEAVLPVFPSHLTLYKGGRGFYNAGSLSAKNVTDDEHKKAAKATYEYVLSIAKSGEYDVIVCDEINNAVHDGLLTIHALSTLINTKHPATTLCLTGRNFPMLLEGSVDIMTKMTKVRHHFDDGYIANEGIDY
jgi:cob(I)alamin adenosyltransferase